MIVSFEENVQERDCTILFEFNGKFDICMTVIEVLQKLGCCAFTVKQAEGIVDLRIETKQKGECCSQGPISPQMAHKDVGQNST